MPNPRTPSSQQTSGSYDSPNPLSPISQELHLSAPASPVTPDDGFQRHPFVQYALEQRRLFETILNQTSTPSSHNSFDNLSTPGSEFALSSSNMISPMTPPRPKVPGWQELRSLAIQYSPSVTIPSSPSSEGHPFEENTTTETVLPSPPPVKRRLFSSNPESYAAAYLAKEEAVAPVSQSLRSRRNLIQELAIKTTPNDLQDNSVQNKNTPNGNRTR